MPNSTTVHVEVPLGTPDVVRREVPRAALPGGTDEQGLQVTSSPIPGVPDLLLVTFGARPTPPPVPARNQNRAASGQPTGGPRAKRRPPCREA
jgi:hypothetical protein